MHWPYRLAGSFAAVAAAVSAVMAVVLVAPAIDPVVPVSPAKFVEVKSAVVLAVSDKPTVPRINKIKIKCCRFTVSSLSIQTCKEETHFSALKISKKVSKCQFVGISSTSIL